MERKWLFAASFFGIMLSAFPAQADQHVLIYAAKGGALKPNALYAIETHCTKKADFPAAQQIGLFPSQSFAASHAILVTTTGLAAAADLSKPPSTLVSLALPFSVNNAPTNGGRVDNRNDCDTNFLLKGPSTLFLTAVFSDSTTTNPGAIATALQDVISIATSLAPVVTGAPLRPNTSKTLGDVQGALPPLQNLFALLFPSTSATEQTTSALQLGTTIVDTFYSRARITVRPITSVVDDKNTVYFNDFNKLIDQLTYTTDSCAQVPATLGLSGFGATNDQAYGLARLAGKSLASGSLVAGCLGATLCTPAIAPKMDEILWNAIPSRKPTTQQCWDIQPPPIVADSQPQWNQIGPTVQTFVNLYGQFVANQSLPPTFATFANPNFAVKIAVDDQTSMLLFGGAQFEDARSLFDLLKAKGFARLGCYQALADTSVMTYNARVSIVGIKLDPAKAGQFKIADAIALYPLWGGGKIVKLVVSNNPNDILASIGTSKSCGDLSVEGPVQANAK